MRECRRRSWILEVRGPLALGVSRAWVGYVPEQEDRRRGVCTSTEGKTDRSAHERVPPRAQRGVNKDVLPPDMTLLQEQRVYRGPELGVYGGRGIVRRPRGDLHRVRGRLARHDGRLSLESSAGSQATVCPLRVIVWVSGPSRRPYGGVVPSDEYASVDSVGCEGMEISRVALRWRRSAFPRSAGDWRLATGGEVSIIRPPATVDFQGSRQSSHSPRPYAISCSKYSNITQPTLGSRGLGWFVCRP